MPSVTQLSTARRLVLLAQEAADVAPAEVDDALQHVLDRLATWIGASNAYWVGALRDPNPDDRDPMGGWRARDLRYLVEHERLTARTAEMVSRVHGGEVDPATAANVRQAGRTRARRRRDDVPDEVWNGCWMVHEYQRPYGVHDQLVGAHTLAFDRESYIGLTRDAHEPAFGRRERDHLLHFMEASRGFHQRLMFFRGLGGVTALTAREREVLRWLVTDRNELEIASALDLGPRTVHQHATAIYRKLGVRGRLGLISLLAGGTKGEARRHLD